MIKDCPIPQMVHPLGSVWQQPDLLHLVFDKTHVLMGLESFEKLHNHETSVPTGVYPGKMWRRGNLLCWYEETKEDPDVCMVRSREILVV